MDLGAAVTGIVQRPLPPAGRPQAIPTNQNNRSRDQTITYASPKIPLQSNARSPIHSLGEITWVEGDIQRLDEAMLRSLQAFCAKYKTQNLPCARSLWNGGDQSLELARAGNRRRWVAQPTGEELRMGRFKYGRRQQIIVAQAPETSNWENGTMVIIVFGGRHPTWQIWRYQQSLDQIPEDDRTVTCELLPSTTQSSQRIGLAARAILNAPNDSDDKSQPEHAVVQTPQPAVHPPPAMNTQQNAAGLLKITYKQGDIKRLPREVESLLREFFEDNSDCKLPCVSTDWPFGTSLYQFSNGDTRRWETIAGEERLQIGYFSYGIKQKILVVRGSTTSNWQNGAARVIVLAAGSNQYKIWTGERVCTDIPQEHTLVRWVKLDDPKSEGEEAPTELTANRRRQPRGGIFRSVEGEQPQFPTKATQSVTETSNTTGKRRREPSDIQANDSELARADDRAKRRNYGQVAPENSSSTDVIEVSNAARDDIRQEPLVKEGTALARTSGTPALTPDIQLRDGRQSSTIPIRPSPAPQALSRPAVVPQVRVTVEKPIPEPGFDLSTVTIFFFDSSSDEPVFDSTFAEAFDIKTFFIRAKVAGIATNDALSLKVEVGKKDNWVQRNVQKDYDRLLAVVVKHQVTEISVRFDS
jgi:hypothetical protein